MADCYRKPKELKFEGNQAQNWKEFKEDFEIFVEAAHSEKTDKQKAYLLLNLAGREAIEKSRSFTYDAARGESKEKLTTLLEKFETLCDPVKNLTMERYAFNSRNQKEGEPLSMYIACLRDLANTCEFGDLKDSLLTDRIVCGIRNNSLRKTLLKETKLTLVKAVELCSVHEKTEAHLKSFDKVNISESVDYVSKKHGNTSRTRSRPKSTSESKSGQNPSSSKGSSSISCKCKWCGKNVRHKRHECPANGMECFKCHKIGHFAAVCRSKSDDSGKNTNRGQQRERVNEIEEFSDSDFLGEVEIDSVDDTDWLAKVQVNGDIIEFKIDTGARVNVIGESHDIVRNLRLSDSNKTLTGPGQTPLKCLGSANVKFKYKSNEVEDKIYVIAKQKVPLLSRKTSVELGMVTRIDSVNQENFIDTKYSEFSDMFRGLGVMKDVKCKIQLKEDASPVCVMTPRKVSQPLLPKIKASLDKMERLKVISPVKEPTEWCSGIVCVRKPDDTVRICVDLTELNKSVKREVYPMGNVDANLAKLANSTMFTKLNCNNGFWQLPLDEESRLLTTFITPYGRYCFNRMPPGVTCAPEIFQRQMSEIVKDLPFVICQMDDILIHSSPESHIDCVKQTLQKLKAAGVTLNKSKCAFHKSSVKFLGHIIDETGIHVDDDKIEAITKYQQPKSVSDLRRFLGMVNQVGKFVPRLADLRKPLNDLLCKNVPWYWGHAQEKAFEEIKNVLISTEVLAHYDPKLETIVATDASVAGLGAVLYQIQPDGKRRPVFHASRSLNDAERNYAVIEKEALAVCWGCDKFSEYLLGLEFTVETDHKPLVSLLMTKELTKLPPRILRFRLRLMRYGPRVVYVPGKDQEIKEAQMCDEECRQIREYCMSGWPPYKPGTPFMQKYFEHQSHFTVVDDLVVYDARIVVPRELRRDILSKIHQGHLGITKCRSRARSSVWWPGMSKMIEEMVKDCEICRKYNPPKTEPLLPTALPSRAWEQVGTDLFHHKGSDYIIVVDYYSRWFEIEKLGDTSSKGVIKSLKKTFSTHGIPDLVVSDNGPQYSSAEFRDFAKLWKFSHITSSPKFPQSNGEAERAVKTAKALLNKNDDPYLALLSYRTSPLLNGKSPSELLMNRKLATQLPILESQLTTKADLSEIPSKEEQSREKLKQWFDKRHRVGELPNLQKGDNVYVTDLKRNGTIVEKRPEPRSYSVETDNGNIVRRNRRAIIQVSPPNTDPDQQTQQPSGDPPVTTRSGRVVKTPTRFKDFVMY
ncbi:hypothetical protein HOLleu_26545 [Holothuria leucospilota]|uniref:Endonuclease n=1 Tax=Holothuria leucospilota TaxID=206669 RepID=A0A9Q1BP51_HOLLE|nr:hypothetical protein HOLleu_26545 [Holothuria leucospilota]